MVKFIRLYVLCLLFIGCSKDDHDSCYDSSLVHDDPCTFDCPGFEGCDGNIYCNQCEAASLGIGPK